MASAYLHRADIVVEKYRYLGGFNFMISMRIYNILEGIPPNPLKYKDTCTHPKKNPEH